MSLARSNAQLQTVRALDRWIEVEYIGRFLGKPSISRPLLNVQRNKETTAMLADKKFLGELNFVRFCPLCLINAVTNHVIETCAKSPLRISIGISITC